MSTKLAFILAAAAVIAASAASASPYERAAEVRALASANVLDEGVATAGYGRSLYHPEYEISEPVYHNGLMRGF